MTNEGLVLYKLMVLYMLDRVDFPLTFAQISQFVLDKGYTSYFNLQIAINELIENDFIKPTAIIHLTMSISHNAVSKKGIRLC